MGIVNKTCKDCSRSFTINEREQAFYKAHDLVEPNRCKSCRAKRKAQREKMANG